MIQKVVLSGVNTSNLPKLSVSDSELLLKRISKGDDSARQEFIISNMRLVLSVIKRFWAKKVNSDDVFQAGCIGLIKAVDNFDLSVGVKFSTYAVPMIIGEIKRYLRDVNSLRVSRSIRDTAYQVLKTRSELEKENLDSGLNEIAKRLNIKESEVTYALDALSDTVSLYEPVYNNKSGDTLLLMDQIGDDKNTDDTWTEMFSLDTAVKKLKAREKKILYLRYYEGKTQTEISEEVGISQAQVSRLEKSALKEIKACLS